MLNINKIGFKTRIPSSAKMTVGIITESKDCITFNLKTNLISINITIQLTSVLNGLGIKNFEISENTGNNITYIADCFQYILYVKWT